MGIEFHCSKCGKLIRARGTSGGRHGKCPYCKESVYIPTPPEDIEEIPVAPLDTEEEERDRRLREEALRYVTALDKEETPKYDTGEPMIGGDSAVALPRDFEVDIPELVNEFLSAMTASDMDRADTAVRQLRTHPAAAKSRVQELMVDELPPADLSAIPVGVYKGFLRELLKRLK
jgi:phage FluMu protein Com